MANDFDILDSYDFSTAGEFGDVGGPSFDSLDLSAPSKSTGWTKSEIQGLGLIGQGIGSYMQGVEEKQAYYHNAALVREQGVIEQYQLGREDVSTLSSARAMTAKSGLTQSGSPLDAALASASGFELDKQIANYNTQSRANELEWEGKQAKKSGEFSGLLQGVEGIAMLALL